MTVHCRMSDGTVAQIAPKWSGQHLAVHVDMGTTGWFSITHVATGFNVRSYGLLSQATRIARALDDMDWTPLAGLTLETPAEDIRAAAHPQWTANMRRVMRENETWLSEPE